MEQQLFPPHSTRPFSREPDIDLFVDSKTNEKIRQERRKSDSPIPPLPEGPSLGETSEQLCIWSASQEQDLSCVVNQELQGTPNFPAETDMEVVKR